MRTPRPVSTASALLSLALVLAAQTGCREEPIDGLLPAGGGNGPAVVFDVLARPLPEIPFPNDFATRLDPDSPTGRRVNASLVAPTLLEQEVREEFSRLDGWGTYAPMTVGFTHAIDPNDVRDRHLNDAFDDDAVYVVNLLTGEPTYLDLGRGNFPVVIQDNAKYFDNDPRRDSSNLLFETYSENCVPDTVPSMLADTDHDGLCDFPNTIDPTKPASGWPQDGFAPVDPAQRGNDQYRDLLTHYERQSHTLIIRPVVPLKQRTPYAVVLTRRIVDEQGRPVRSPFPFVNHASQTEQLRPLLSHIDAGTIPGLERDDVAFAWAFTTQSVTTDLEHIRDGLNGKGPLAWLSERVPDRLEPVVFYEEALDEEADDPDYVPPLDLHPVHPMQSGTDNPYIVEIDDFESVFSQIAGFMGFAEGPPRDALLESYAFVDYFVVGSFQTANFLDDPQRPTFDSVFRVSGDDGLARVWSRPEGWMDLEIRAQKLARTQPFETHRVTALRQEAKRALRDRVWFLMTVPKPQYRLGDGTVVFERRDDAERIHDAPFPVSIYGHGYTSNRVEFLGFAGALAKFGIASVSVDSYGHGLDLEPTDLAAIKSFLGSRYAGITESLFQGRGRDLNNDGLDDSGGDFWVADTFHTRDVVRQTVVDWAQLVRVFRAFGTYEMGDLNGDGVPELAGDFDGDGIVDVGGPEFPKGRQIDRNVDWPEGTRNGGSDFFAWGQSLGGFISGIIPAIEPAIVAAAPVAGGAGLADVGIRSEQGGVIQAVFLEVLGPLLIGVPADATSVCGRTVAQPPGKGVHLWYVLQDVNVETCLRLTDEPLDIREGDVVRGINLNVDSTENVSDVALVRGDLRFRLQIAADTARLLDDNPIKVDEDGNHPTARFAACDPGAVKAGEDGLVHHADCIAVTVERKGKTVLAFDRFTSAMISARNEAHFQNRVFEPGTPLYAPSRGFAHKRGTPDFRRFLSLAQTILEPGDPANYSPHIFQDLLPAREGRPAAVMVIGTTGDLNVPVNTAYAQARAAGVVPYVYDEEKHAAWGMSPNDVLIRTGAMESVEKLRYFRPVADHVREPDADVHPLYRDIVSLIDCQQATHCDATTLPDLSHYSKDADGVFLDDANLTTRYGGAPRLKVPLREAVTVEHDGFDPQGKPIRVKSLLVTPFLDAHGKHGFDPPTPAQRVGGEWVPRPFDNETFMLNLVGRYFETRGADVAYKTCMHTNGYDRPRLKMDGTRDPEAKRLPECDFLPPHPED